MTGAAVGSHHVRSAGPGDCAGVAALLAPDRDVHDEVVTSTWERLVASDSATVYVAEIDGEIVGTATLVTVHHITYDCRPTGFIEAVHVMDTHRRRGIGTALLERLVEDARAGGCHKLQLLSHKRHEADGGHALYRSVDFTAEAEGFRRYLEPPIP